MINQKGITLIVLVITIIVLLILAGVSISAVMGENGIASKAKMAKENTRAGVVEERLNLGVSENEMLKQTGGELILKRTIVEDLEQEGILKPEEVDYLLGRNGKNEIDVITIGEKEINFGILNIDTIETSGIIWENGVATVGLSTNSEYEIEWKIDTAEEWIKGTNATGLQHNDILLYRLVNGTSYISTQQLQIKDTIPPVVNLEVEQTSDYVFEVNVTATDAESGIPESDSCSYYVKASTDEYDDEPRGVGNIGVCMISFNPTDDLLYDIKVIVTDIAGNSTIAEINDFQAHEVTGCFVAETQISTPDGLINIEDLKVGDKVYTFNETTKQVEEQNILEKFIYERSEIYTLIFESGEQIKNTSEHPYYVIGKGWILTKNLEVGDKILTQNKEQVEIESIQINKGKRINVYNITVGVNNNYFVGTTKLLVHNKGNCFAMGTKISTPNGLINIEELKVGDKVYTYNEITKQVEEQEILANFEYEVNEIYTLIFENGEQIKNTSEHPYYVIGKGWILTKNLEIGDKILTQNNAEIEIEKIEINTEENIRVYNITVDNNHNYFVGTTKLLVHNKI